MNSIVQIGRSFVKISLFFLVYFAIYRLVFILNYALHFDLDLTIRCLAVGLKFDIGISMILAILSILFYAIHSNFSNIIVDRVLFVVYFVLWVFIVLVQFIDFQLFYYWQSLFNLRAANYLSNISAVLPNIDFFKLVFTCLSVIAIAAVLTYMALDKLLFSTAEIKINKWYHFIGIFILAGSSFILLRGGFREIPLNHSDAHFCKDKVYNLAALNSLWNFGSIYINHQQYSDKNPYTFFPNETLIKSIEELQTAAPFDNVKLFSQSSDLSIVIITMEGINAQLLKTHNHQVSHMPFLESYIDSGYYFAKCYSTGFRTEQGLTAILSGLLTTPHSNLTDDISKLDAIPSIISSFKKRKYKTSFLFGGDIEFANMKSYLSYIGMDKIVDINSFHREERTQSLGVDDQILFDRAGKQFKQQLSPFFLQIMTQSSHEPYDIAINKNINNEEEKYINSARFLDSAIHQFIEGCRKTPQFANTIFIITSDHAHQCPGRIDIANPERYHIPFLIFSPKLNPQYRGVTDTILFSQVNIPATLSYMLNFNESHFSKFSKNHFSNSKKWSFSSFVEGYVYIEDTNVLTHEYVWGKNDFRNKNLLNQHKKPLSIMQYLTDQVIGVRPIKEK